MQLGTLQTRQSSQWQGQILFKILYLLLLNFIRFSKYKVKSKFAILVLFAIFIYGQGNVGKCTWTVKGSQENGFCVLSGVPGYKFCFMLLKNLYLTFSWVLITTSINLGS